MFTAEQLNHWKRVRDIGNGVKKREAREKYEAFKKDGHARKMYFGGNSLNSSKKIVVKYKSDIDRVKNGNNIDYSERAGHTIMKDIAGRPKRYRGKEHYGAWDRKF